MMQTSECTCCSEPVQLTGVRSRNGAFDMSCNAASCSSSSPVTLDVQTLSDLETPSVEHGRQRRHHASRPSLLSRGSSLLLATVYPTAHASIATTQRLSSTEQGRRDRRGHWPHNWSAPLAVFCCTVSSAAICRFALFGAVFGAAFLAQFYVLSLLLGLPLLTLHMTLGQYSGTAGVQLWRIAPVFKGVGMSLVLTELVSAIYTAAPSTWLFVYLRDSFVSGAGHYRWARCTEPPTDGASDAARSASFENCSNSATYVDHLTRSVPDYLNYRVLRRDMSAEAESLRFGQPSFQLSFNLAIVWVLVYLFLGRGLRSYGRLVYVCVVVAVVAFVTVCIQLLSWTDQLSLFFTDRKLFDSVFWSAAPWVVAARETFLVWSLHSVAIATATSHERYARRRLCRHSTLVAVLTLSVLSLASLFGWCCVQSLRTLNGSGYSVDISSFESIWSSRFLRVTAGVGSSHGRTAAASLATPLHQRSYTNLPLGVLVHSSSPNNRAHWTTGYQVYRVATELYPSLVAAAGRTIISPFWPLLFYLSLIVFNIGHQLTIWGAVIEAVVSSSADRWRHWRLSVTFVLCVLGFVCSLPMTSQIGIYIIYFIDYCFGSLWWLIAVQAMQLMALFYVRGAPFSAAHLAALLVHGSSCVANLVGPLLTFFWHAVLPLSLLVLSVVTFRAGGYSVLFSDWTVSDGGATSGMWSLWWRQAIVLLMVAPLVAVPVVALLQLIKTVATHRPPHQLIKRVFLLGRADCSDIFIVSAASSVPGASSQASNTASAAAVTGSGARYSDPPPKYTPPPSYSTATGAGLSKLLRRSFRRLHTALSGRTTNNNTTNSSRSSSLPASTASTSDTGQPAMSPSTADAAACTQQAPPPSYASLLFEQIPVAFCRSMGRISVRLAGANQRWTDAHAHKRSLSLVEGAIGRFSRQQERSQEMQGEELAGGVVDTASVVLQMGSVHNCPSACESETSQDRDDGNQESNA